jgi:hypothetical protein
LVDQRASLAELLDTAPLAADNLLNAYDPAHRVIDGRTNINELSGGGTSAARTPSGTTAARTQPGTTAAAPAGKDTAGLPLPFPAVGDATTEGAAR